MAQAVLSVIMLLNGVTFNRSHILA